MDLEQLSVSQIILLALLVSFVTSIATGIVTASLLAQAPQAVTNTVNQVVERTIETIVPKNSGSTVVQQKTVIVKEDDQVTSSIALALSKTGLVHQGTSSTSPVIGLAEAISGDTALTASALVDKDVLVSFGASDKLFSVSQRFPEIGVAVLTAKSGSSTSSFPVGTTDDLKLGQTVVAIASVLNERVEIGAVSAKSVLAKVSQNGADAATVRSVDTTISGTLSPGTPLINVFGDLVGMYTAASGSVGAGSFVSVSDVVRLLAPAATSTPPASAH